MCINNTNLSKFERNYNLYQSRLYWLWKFYLFFHFKLPFLLFLIFLLLFITYPLYYVYEKWTHYFVGMCNPLGVFQRLFLYFLLIFLLNRKLFYVKHLNYLLCYKVRKIKIKQWKVNIFYVKENFTKKKFNKNFLKI